MQSLSRGHFLADSGVGIAAAALHADPLRLPIGCQTYPVRDALGKDLNGTLHQLASIGVQARRDVLASGLRQRRLRPAREDEGLGDPRRHPLRRPGLRKLPLSVRGGYEAATYLTKYPGRFLSLHLQDWSSEEKKQVPVGKGVVEWTKLFAAAKKGGVKNYFVELGMDALQPSYDYPARDAFVAR